MTANTSKVEFSTKLLDVKGVAIILDCSPRHVYRMVDAGRMPAPAKLGALVRFDRQKIEDWIASGCKPVRTVKAKGGIA